MELHSFERIITPLRIKATLPVNIENLESIRLNGELMTEYFISWDSGLTTASSRPNLVGNLDPNFSIEYAEELEEDPLYKHFMESPHDATLIPILDSNPENLRGVSIISDRRFLLSIINYCLPLRLPNPVKPQNFKVLVRNIQGILIFHLIKRYDAPGGYSRGMKNVLVTYDGQVDNEDRRRSCYYRINQSTINDITFMTRTQADALDNQGKIVHIKCIKQRPGNSPILSIEMAVSLWTKIVVSDIDYIKVCFHHDGIVHTVQDYTLSQIQNIASISDDEAKRILTRLTNFLKLIQHEMHFGDNAILSYTANTKNFTLGINLNEGLPNTLISLDIKARMEAILMSTYLK